MALAVGAGAGLGAVGFRWLIFEFTWLATGHQQFGQQGRVGSLHLPWLGTGFLLVVPVLGGLIYGPLIQRFAREARGHGVPEVMIAVAEDGGRIRPQVTVVKALASALCIGVGGSVGREGPIVQIGSALASSLGQVVRMSETRLRVLVACGAAGGIAATFNAPITGVFFGLELILRELSIDAVFAAILSAAGADLISRAFFGSAPFFTEIPHDLNLVGDYNFLLVALLGLIAGLLGVGFKTVLYKIEDFCDKAWHGRPEWARPAVGGVVLGALLLALPQMYGVGYPVMDLAISGHVVLWLLVVLTVAKMVAASLTIGIGGSGGVFAPSLFTGAMAGTAFGEIARHLFGTGVGSPAIYGVIAMGAVFASAAQAPLTAMASVVEMTGNFSLTLPVMLAAGISAGLSKRLSHGTIYTTKLLRRGTDIERPRPASLLQTLTVSETMKPIPGGDIPGIAVAAEERRQVDLKNGAVSEDWAADLGHLIERRSPQALFPDETLEHALRQLVLYGPDGLPVLSEDRNRIVGWITSHDVIQAMSNRLLSYPRDASQGNVAAEWATPDPAASARVPPSPLPGYEILEVALSATMPGAERRLQDIDWPAETTPVAVRHRHRTRVVNADTVLRPGDHVIVLVPHAPDKPDRDEEQVGVSSSDHTAADSETGK
ncbi:MAG TPA: chloride channel protein [Acidimicrobiales bacterium]|nr:chloride channel protein [Acidimicrobiales bacterium]